MGMTQYSYSEGDADWYATFLKRCEEQSKGFIGLSLTNFATSTVCAIAAGSVVEIDGAVFVASANINVSGSIATGLNYIVCSITDTTAEPYWSQSAASTYDTAKQGYYTAAERYVAGCTSDGTTYDGKWVYDAHAMTSNNRIQEDNGKILRSKVIELGDWNMDLTGNSSIAVSHGLSLGRMRSVAITIRNDNNTAYYPIDFNNEGLRGGFWHAEATMISITRELGGAFDSNGYDALSYNRGWILIWYEV